MRRFHAQHALPFVGGSYRRAASVRMDLRDECNTAVCDSWPPVREEALDRDRLLQLSRRVDWRFLLPDLSLRRVALLGDDDQELVAALRQFSEALSLLDLGWTFPAGQEPHYDVVVLRSTRLSDVKKARSLVEPGGTLYWEIEHPGYLEALRRESLHLLRHPAGRVERPDSHLRSSLDQLGFTDLQLHWHRPHFKSCLEMIPLEERAVVDYVFRTRSRTLKGRLQRICGEILKRTGLLNNMVPCLSVVARYRGKLAEVS